MAKERGARLGDRRGNRSWMAGCKRPEDAQNPAFLQLSDPLTPSFGFLPSEREELPLYDHWRILFYLNFLNFHIFTRRTQGLEDVLWISVDPLYGNLSHRQCFKKRWVSTETLTGCLMTFPGIRWGQPKNEGLWLYPGHLLSLTCRMFRTPHGQSDHFSPEIQLLLIIALHNKRTDCAQMCSHGTYILQ